MSTAPHGVVVVSTHLCLCDQFDMVDSQRHTLIHYRQLNTNIIHHTVQINDGTTIIVLANTFRCFDAQLTPLMLFFILKRKAAAFFDFCFSTIGLVENDLILEGPAAETLLDQAGGDIGDDRVERKSREANDIAM